jgi:RNA polymerase sigma-70 factor, ECF subfamily
MAPALSETPSSGSNVRALPQAVPDAELIELVMSGSQEAAGRLYDRFARDIHRMVHRLLAVDTEHEDVVHEIFIKAWQLIAKGKVRNPEGLSAWMRSVATHTVYKEIRRRYVRRRFFRFQEPPPDATANIASEDERELLQIAYHIAAKLAPAEQLAFALRHFDQRRLVEVAELSGCSLATAKRRIARAEQQFLTLAAQYRDYPALLGLTNKKETE